MGLERKDETEFNIFGIDGVSTIGKEHRVISGINPTITDEIHKGLVKSILDNCNEDARYMVEVDGKRIQGIVDGVRYMDAILENRFELTHGEYVKSGKPQAIRRTITYESVENESS